MLIISIGDDFLAWISVFERVFESKRIVNEKYTQVVYALRDEEAWFNVCQLHNISISFSGCYGFSWS